MTALAERQDEAVTESRSGLSAGWLRSGWIPFLLAVVVTVPVLKYFGVRYGDTAKFGLYTLLANTLPGLLIWRAVRGKAGRLGLDAAFGTTLGFAIELPVYMFVRQIGLPVAVVAWPVLTVLLFAAVPALRKHWRGSGERLPAGVAWTAALGFLFVLAGIAMTQFRWNSLAEPWNATMSMDYPFQFALVGEFKHHVPLNTPWVTGTALQYHWYVYAHGAAASWLTGIEPQTLILRLLPLPMVAAFLLVVVALVHRLTGRWWPGNLAVVLMLVGVAVSPWGWTDRATFTGIITDNLWVSPTQTYAALFFVAVCFVLAGILRAEGAERKRPARWIILAFLLGAVAGAKATFLPMVLCGLLLAVVLRLIFRRSVGAELVAFGITLFWFGFAQLVLYGSGSQGAEVDPLQTIKWTPLGQAVMGRQSPVDHWTPILALTVAGIAAMAFSWVGLVGLLRRDWRMDPTVHVMLGFAIAGAGGLWAIAHPGLSQTYFARSASPYFAILSAIGLAALIPAARRAPRGFAWLAGGGAALAVVSVLVVQNTIGHQAPASQFGVWTLRHALFPYAVLTAVVLVLAAVVVVLTWRFGRRYALGAAVILVLATTVTSGAVGTKSIWNGVTAGLFDGKSERHLVVTDGRYAMPVGAIEAGRWLRDHSDPLDVVATNSHCRTDVGGCDSRDFWLAAYSERQIVVEGWSYTEQAFETGGLWDGTLARSTFWDQPLLAANDAVFYHPTAADVSAFTQAHQVKWLVSVRRSQDATEIQKSELRTASPDLAKYATVVFRAGDVTIYQVR